mmetsp:Transcript_14009/g.21786  ORF Transcript_14009/g.21786 Transcript_14009/m.21786 type:complete len:391 (+) Transcript_14009:1585-2757(+)
MVIQKRLLDRVERIKSGKASVNITLSLIQLFRGLKHPRRQITFVFGSTDFSSNLLQALDMRGVVGGTLQVVLTQQGNLDGSLGGGVNLLLGVQIGFLLVNPSRDLSVTVLVASSLDSHISSVNFTLQIIIQNGPLLVGQLSQKDKLIIDKLLTVLDFVSALVGLRNQLSTNLLQLSNITGLDILGFSVVRRKKGQLVLSSTHTSHILLGGEIGLLGSNPVIQSLTLGLVLSIQLQQFPLTIQLSMESNISLSLSSLKGSHGGFNITQSATLRRVKGRSVLVAQTGGDTIVLGFQVKVVSNQFSLVLLLVVSKSIKLLNSTSHGVGDRTVTQHLLNISDMSPELGGTLVELSLPLIHILGETNGLGQSPGSSILLPLSGHSVVVIRNIHNH